MHLENNFSLTPTHAESEESCRKLAQKLSCMDSPWEVPEYTAWSGGTASGSIRTSAGSFEPVTGGTSALHTPTHYSGERS
jgi:hypothetical protein